MTPVPVVGGNRRFTLVSLAEVVPCDVIPLIDHIERFFPGRIKSGVSPRFKEIEAFEIRRSYRYARRIKMNMYSVQLGLKKGVIQ